MAHPVFQGSCLHGGSGNVRMEPGAVVCRVARSFVRFGSFQLPVSRGSGEAPLVRLLADYTIRHHFPHLLGAPVCRVSRRSGML